MLKNLSKIVRVDCILDFNWKKDTTGSENAGWKAITFYHHLVVSVKKP
jgi:hypothetical protein